MEEELKVKYNEDCTKVYLGMQTTDDSSYNDNEQLEPSKEKEEKIEDANSNIHYVQYSEYKLLLHKVNELENANAKLVSTIKQLSDELQAVHSQLNYLIENFNKSNQQ